MEEVKRECRTVLQTGGELYRGAKADLEGPTNVDATLALVQLPTRCTGAVCALPRTNWNRTKPRNPTGMRKDTCKPSETSTSGPESKGSNAA